MTTTATPPAASSKLLIYILAGVVSLLVAAPHVFFPFGKALLCSASMAVLFVTIFLVVLLGKSKKASSPSPDRQTVVLLTIVMLQLALSMFLASASIGVFFHFTFWKALLLCVAITLGGAIFLMLSAFVTFALNRGFLEKRPIDPDAPR